MTAATIEAPLDLRALWQRWRLPAILVGLTIAVAVAIAAVQNAPPQRPLDPRDASPVGARALAELLRQRGVTVTATVAVPVAATAEGTVFIPDPQSLSRADLTDVAALAANVVVVGPTSRELHALGIDAVPTGHIGDGTLQPSCVLTAATIAGDINYSGLTYQARGALTDCYPAGAGAGLLLDERPGHFLAVIGSGRVWSNERLADDGDAALALGLLSGRTHLDWVLPRPPSSAVDREHKGLLSLLPARLLWAALQLFIVVVVVALWRARRLGPVITEPLPVIVPSVETVRGRARLLRAAKAHEAAANELRTAAVRRISDVVGLGANPPPAAVVAAVVTRTGRSGADVESVLFGAAPTDDKTLVALAASLDELELTMKGRR